MFNQNTLKKSSKNITLRKNHRYLGFTLVELIITISILAILATVGLSSIKNYYNDARNSTRITDIKSVQKGLVIFQLKTGHFFLPDNALQVNASSGVILSYQGYIGDTISRIININKVPLDPKDATKYTYTIDRVMKKAQFMGYLESGYTYNLTAYRQNIINQFIHQGYANGNSVDYQNRFIYIVGDTIGVLTDENNTPLQESTTATGINLQSIDTSGIVAHFGGNAYGSGTSTGTGDVLIHQMIGAITNTIPCNPTAHSGYTISSLSDNEIGIFIKTLTIPNGIGTGSLQVQCQNGILDLPHANETTTFSCNAAFVNIGNNICADQTPPTITNITATTSANQPACNTIRFIINGATDLVGLHTTPYTFDGGSNWQTENTKDYTNTTQNISANQIKVRDAVGNIYTYESDISGTSSSCQSNPTNLAITHTTRTKNFTFSWTAGVGNNASCKLQYLKNGITWTDISATTYNCDNNISNQNVTLPADGWNNNWSSISVRVIRSSDNTPIGSFPQNLLCSAIGSSSSSTPTIDEDCNGIWDNSTSSQSCSNYDCSYNNCYTTTCSQQVANGQYNITATCNGQGVPQKCTPTGGIAYSSLSGPSCSVSYYVAYPDSTYWTVNSCVPQYTTQYYSCQQCNWVNQSCQSCNTVYSYN